MFLALTRFSLSMENEQADAGRDGGTHLARPNPQALTGTRRYHFFLFIWPQAGLATLLHTYILYAVANPVCGLVNRKRSEEHLQSSDVEINFIDWILT